MSGAIDVLMYVDRTDVRNGNMDKFNVLVASAARIKTRPLQVDTDSFPSPNAFWGTVWAFGADCLLSYDIQECIEKVQWERPQNVVALVTWHNGHDGFETALCRPLEAKLCRSVIPGRTRRQPAPGRPHHPPRGSTDESSS